MDDLPDAIARLVEQKVQAALAARDLAEQRTAFVRALARRSHDVRRAEDAVVARAAAVVAEHAAQKQELIDARAHLQRLRLAATPAPPRFVRLSPDSTKVVVVLGLVIGGWLFPSCIEPVVGFSLPTAALLCPYVCEGCHGPGRVFTRSQSSGSSTTSNSDQICHNPKVDIDPLSQVDGYLRRDGDLSPYGLSLWWSALVDAAIATSFLLLFFSFAEAKNRRITVVRDRARLEARIGELEALFQSRERDVGTTAYR